MRSRIMKLAVIIALLMVGSFIFPSNDTSAAKLKRMNTGMADSDALSTSYQKWSTNFQIASGDTYVQIDVGSMRGLSAESSQARGNVRVNLTQGTAWVNIENLAEGEWQAWLVHNNPGEGTSTMMDPTDELISLGTFTSDGKEIVNMRTELGNEMVRDFDVDRVFITRAGVTPGEGFVLSGAPTLFERIHRREAKINKQAALNTTTTNYMSAGLRWLLADSTVQAQSGSTNFDQLVAKGRQLFTKETFGGNGRTCNSCHQETNNFTVDPKFIATLPPNDPLFVAEYNPDLANNFEKPAMLRKFGLFVENVDGMEDLTNKFTLRSANHTLALATTIAPVGIPIDPTAINGPKQRLGWSGDGAPGSGTLREFAIGAITQHFTKTLSRKMGNDFRMPTDDELDALEAFQLSLGRQEDFDFNVLQLRDKDTRVGQKLFNTANSNDGGVSKKCSACHVGGGANAGFAPPDFFCLNCTPLGFNTSFDINTENDPLVIQFNLPPDGGFGTVDLGKGFFGTCNRMPILGFCEKVFNTAPVIESPDTAPYFHHHLTETLEDTVAFYGTPTFNTSVASNFQVPPGNRLAQINLTQQETNSISSFIRVLNALENIRSSIALEQRSKNMADATAAKELASFAANETGDAVRVLTDGALAARVQSGAKSPILSAVLYLNTAKTFLISAALTNDTAARNALLDQAMKSARSARSSLANPQSLPRSFQN